MTVSSAVLAERLKGNDPKAFTQLFGRYYSLVFSVCLKLLGHQQDAEDATQETFSRVARYIHRWDSARPLEPWLITIAGNRCRTQLSRRKDLKTFSNVSESVLSRPVDDPGNASRDADAFWEELMLAMNDLSECQRLAFQLFHEQSMTYAEIAEELNCPLGTVKTWVHRARTQLINSLIARGVVASDVVPRKSAGTDEVVHEVSK